MVGPITRSASSRNGSAVLLPYTSEAELTGAVYRRDLGVAGVRGYVFGLANGLEEVVAWATSPSATIVFNQTCVRRMDLFGPVDLILDGSPQDADHAANGQVAVALEVGRPVYLGSCT